MFTICALFQGASAEIQCSRSSSGLISCNEGMSLNELMNEDTMLACEAYQQQSVTEFNKIDTDHNGYATTAE